MPIGGDIVELTHNMQWGGQLISNVYYFENVAGGGSLPLLAAWFETNVVPEVQNLQHDLISHTNLELRNLFNSAETHIETLTGTGVSPSLLVELPEFLAISIRLRHVNGNVRSGFKRIAAGLESQLENGLWQAPIITVASDYAALLVNPPSVANPDWAHVVVSRVCETPNPVPGAKPSCLKYRLPENQGESLVAYPISFEVYTQPTTQNSRKWYT